MAHQLWPKLLNRVRTRPRDVESDASSDPPIGVEKPGFAPRWQQLGVKRTLGATTGTAPPSQQMILGRRHLGLLTATLLVCACTYQVPLEPTIVEDPGIAKLPVAMGVYYTPEFRSRKHFEDFPDKTYSRSYAYDLGTGSVALFDDALSRLFSRTEVVEASPLRSEHVPNVDGVIELAIKKFETVVPEPFWGNWGLFWAEITYGITLYDASGRIVASWTVSGVGEAHGRLIEVTRTRSEVVELAMRDAADFFVLSFRAVPGVRQWLQTIRTPEGA